MIGETVTEATAGRWWKDEGLIDRYASGVFEGGGAKGVLYAGALEAMVEERCWFDAVAGSSAGAITATLIAIGMKPQQVQEQMGAALGTLRFPTRLNGVSRIRDGASYLDQDSLIDWLRQVLEDQFRALAGISGGVGATFEDLYELTGIELNVVAADLKSQRLVVFNHQLTPRCQVAEAVVASAAIPFAFEWMPLHIPDVPWGIIVDGGVAANFPRFVFTDQSFRSWAGLPRRRAASLVVGFLLDEEGKWSHETPKVYREAVFLPPMSTWRSSAKAIEAKSRGLPESFDLQRRKFRAKTSVGRPSLLSKAATVVLFPVRLILWPFTQFFFSWFPRFLAWNGRGTLPRKGNWPEPKSTVLGGFVRWLDQILTGIRPLGVFLVGLVAVSLFLGGGLYAYGWRPLVDHVEDIVAARVSVLGAIIGALFYIGVIAAAVYAWTVLVVLYFGASVAHPTVRLIGYGLAKTFLQGPGAPPWVGKGPGDHVIRLRVPKGMTALSVGQEEKEVEAAIEKARAETRDKMRLVLAESPVQHR